MWRMIAMSLACAFTMGCTLIAGADDMPTAPGQITPDPMAGQGSAPAGPGTMTPEQGVPMQVEAGKVAVTLDAASYDAGAMIAVTVANGLEQTIYAEDLKSDCSIVIIERWDGQDWQPLLDCGIERLALAQAIAPGHGRTVMLHPFSSQFGAAPDAGMPVLEPGTYRIRFTYRLAPGPEGVEPYAAYSEPFHIGS